MTHLDESHTQPIIDALDHARQSTGWSQSRTFKIWLDIVLATLQRDDDTYQTHVETIERDGDPTPILTALARAFGELVYETTTAKADVLGTVYERYGLTADAAGQFFTPPNVAAAIADIQATTIDPNRATSDDPLRIADPACGSGRLLLDMGRWLAREAPSTPVLFVGQDKAPLCARMTTINFVFAGLPGYVTQGNSLTADATATWQIDPTRGVERGPIQEVEPIAFTGPIETDESTQPTNTGATLTSHQQLTLSAFGETTDNG